MTLAPLVGPVVRLARKIPIKAWLAAGVLGLVIGLGLWVGHLYAEVVRLERETHLIEANFLAAQDSTRRLYEAYDAEREVRVTLEARLAVLAELTEAQRAEIDRIPGLEKALRDAKREPTGVIRREIAIDTLRAEGAAPVRTDSADVRHAEFTEDIPGGTLTATVSLGPTMGWAKLTAAIDSCRLVDVFGTNATSAELYQHVEGPCDVTIPEPPVLPATLAYESERPSLLRDTRTWVGVGAGALLAALLTAAF